MAASRRRPQRRGRSGKSSKADQDRDLLADYSSDSALDSSELAREREIWLHRGYSRSPRLAQLEEVQCRRRRSHLQQGLKRKLRRHTDLGEARYGDAHYDDALKVVKDSEVVREKERKKDTQRLRRRLHSLTVVNVARREARARFDIARNKETREKIIREIERLDHKHNRVSALVAENRPTYTRQAPTRQSPAAGFTFISVQYETRSPQDVSPSVFESNRSVSSSENYQQVGTSLAPQQPVPIPTGPRLRRVASQRQPVIPTGPKEFADASDFLSPDKDLSSVVDDNEADELSFNPSTTAHTKGDPTRARRNTSLTASSVDDAETVWTPEGIRKMSRLHAQGLAHVAMAVSTRTMRLFCSSFAISTGQGLTQPAIGYTISSSGEVETPPISRYATPS